MSYVADTHAFLWHLAEDRRLGPGARAILETAENGGETIFVPTIVLAECLRILEKKRLSLKFQEILQKLEVGSNFTAFPLDLRIVSRMTRLTGLTELHDRIIVASADLLGVALITKDVVIQKSGYVRTVW